MYGAVKERFVRAALIHAEGGPSPVCSGPTPNPSAPLGNATGIQPQGQDRPNPLAGQRATAGARAASAFVLIDQAVAATFTASMRVFTCLCHGVPA